MTNYYMQAVVQPEIPVEFLDDYARERLEECGFTCELTPEGWYLHADEGADGYEDTLLEVVRKSKGRLRYLTVEGAFICSKPRPDGFGGFAYLITADGLDYVSTGEWLQTHIPWEEEKSKQE